jgi:hypothetical protein
MKKYKFLYSHQSPRRRTQEETKEERLVKSKNVSSQNNTHAKQQLIGMTLLPPKSMTSPASTSKAIERRASKSTSSSSWSACPSTSLPEQGWQSNMLTSPE